MRQPPVTTPEHAFDRCGPHRDRARRLSATLIVTAGTGWVQRWGGAKQEIRAGDVVWTPPGVKHWHGATAVEGMTHIAVQEHVDGKVVDWLEHVSDEQYAR